MPRLKRNAYQRAWVARNREVVYGRAKICRESNKEKELARYNNWAANNKENLSEYKRGWYARNKEAVKSRTAHRYQTHRRDALAYCYERRAKKFGSDGLSYTKGSHVELRWEVFGNKCWMCGAEAGCTDHVKPLSKGGANLPCNIRPACNPCNSSKGAKWPYPTSTVAA
jgi:5-methylcytosine-specific restriction endonuclease McrA